MGDGRSIRDECQWLRRDRTPLRHARCTTRRLPGATRNASGTVTYSVYDNASCTGTPLRTEGTKTVTNATVPDSDADTFSAPGTYDWQASYSGDTYDFPSTSDCGSEVLTVDP